jgi:DNA/RNA-binding domain of Phe-tRNA-synthetase-like protein
MHTMGALAVDIRPTDAWRTAYPGACIGILALDGVENPPEHAALAARVQQIEDELRSRWAGASRADLLRLPELEAYRRYYRAFDKTYHVQLQLESVALKGRKLRGNGSLVLATFAAELHDLLLTAGHDLAAMQGALVVDVASGGEQYTGLGGRVLALQPNDMCIRDEAGIVSCILYGPDDRSQIRPTTRQAMFCTYAPAGISTEAVAGHLDEIAGNARLIAPGASVAHQQVYSAR